MPDASAKLVVEYLLTEATPTSPVTRYLTNDTLGSPRVITDSSGNIESRRDFMPFGEEISAIGGRTSGLGYQVDATRQKFTSYERDNETELDFAQARFYNSKLGRFNSTDPLYFQLMMAIDPQRFNLYGYSRNNPIKWVDPDGEKLYLRGNTSWLQTNVLYQMAGTQEDFDKYFEIREGQVFLKDEVDISGANAGIQELAGLVGDSENYLFFAGTDGNEVAKLFKDTSGKDNKLNDRGNDIANEFTGNNDQSRGGSVVGTSGRGDGALQPANLANGDPVFCVIAINTNAVFTQDGVDNSQRDFIAPIFLDRIIQVQREGLNQVIQPVSYFIHEATENRKFAEQMRTQQYMMYSDAHSYAVRREAKIRKALNITGGFSGGSVKRRVPKP